jgi:hypothetical protein
MYDGIRSILEIRDEIVLIISNTKIHGDSLGYISSIRKPIDVLKKQ